MKALILEIGIKMAEGKIRTSQHITGDRAVKIIKDRILPPEWVVREMTPDYGIDLDVELFDYENDKCVTLGEHIFVQAKGTESPTYGKDNITLVYRFVMRKFDKYEQLLNWCKRAYPNLLFTDDAFSTADKIGTLKENLPQIDAALCALNEIKVGDHGITESEALGYLQAKTGIECTGKGRSEEQTFKKNVKWKGTDDKKEEGCKRKAISCIPHFKLDKSYSNKRIYFNWGLKEILDGKIIVVHVGTHWDETVNKREAEIM